ncbi:glycosyltransferase family 9 protein [Candidatus Sumerlaeota bacterium]|nr:glycosyltransferase family 9 protein [Candidatus Sumerlaeota bacterium]
MNLKDIRFDCRFYNGYKPCGKSLECKGCPYYEPRGTRILLIKLGAMGDVLRTTPILTALKKKYPCSFISWLTDSASYPLLSNNKFIDRLLVFGLKDILPVVAEEFDILINLEKEHRALALAKLVNATSKCGFALTEYGTLGVFNKASEYALMLGLSDELKFRQNQKSYQEIIFEMAELEYNGEEYILELSEQGKRFAERFAKKHRTEEYKHLVGIHTGSGSVFRSKQWTLEGWLELIMELIQSPDVGVVLMGGEAERELNNTLMQRLGTQAERVIDAGCDNSVEEFIGITNLCEVVVALDSLAMHVAIALRKKVVAIFGPTAPQEIDLYGRGIKVVAECELAPCYRNECDIRPRCMEKLTGTEVASKVKELLCSPQNSSSTIAE